MKKFLFPVMAVVLIFTSCQKEFAIAVQSNDTSLGVTAGSGTYLKGTEIEISAIPKSGCEFIKWEDGDTNNPRLVTVNENETYTAVFEKERFFSLILDGEARNCCRVEIDKSDLNKGTYHIRFFLTDDKREYIEILGNKNYHDGQVIDISKQEEKRHGTYTPEGYWYYWSVLYYLGRYAIFGASGHPDAASVSECSGTLYIKRLADKFGKPVFEIRVENGNIKSWDDLGDNMRHTIDLQFKGEMQLTEFMDD